MRICRSLRVRPQGGMAVENPKVERQKNKDAQDEAQPMPGGDLNQRKHYSSAKKPRKLPATHSTLIAFFQPPRKGIRLERGIHSAYRAAVGAIHAYSKPFHLLGSLSGINSALHCGCGLAALCAFSSCNSFAHCLNR